MAYFFKQFTHRDKRLFVTEFGHSSHTEPKTVGPWSRAIYILHFISKGYCDFSGFRADEGQAFLISKEHLHSFAICDDYEHYWIGILGDSLERIFSDFNIDCNRHQLFHVENSDFAKTLFSQALDKLQDDTAEHPDSYVLSVFTAILPLLKPIEQSSMHCKVSYAERVKIFIESNYIYPIRMVDIAKEIHISEKYMYRLFMKRFHTSPQQYLLKTRMKVAKNLLKENKLSVKEIAYSVGYTSYPSFSKVFSKYFGISPSSFKKTVE